eukprot:Phypoly_transcript_04107.p1 GENE.Phypoly_transcript_04107~~Phypoly_transcript_04107.p1  ORF type:complete len:722 (+),score=91.51 Phypoly_transcript_04107:71-2236(+)
MSAFEELGVMPAIIRAVEELDWLLPTPIQQDAIPMILGGGDVLAAAETGSGKTGAFSIPMIQVTHESLREGTVTRGQAPVGVMTMSTEDRDPDFAVAQGDVTTCQSRVPNWQGGRANWGVTKGKYYYEATVTDEGLCRVGWSTMSARLDLGTDRLGFGFGGTGKKSNNKQFDTYGEPFGLNDKIGCYIDLDNFTIGFSKNGKDYGVAFQIHRQMQGAAFYPAAVLKNAEMKFNFGTSDAAPLKHLPEGYTAVGRADPTHVASAAANASAPDAKKVRKPLALILEPSRELAEQTYANIVKFAKYLEAPKIEHTLIVGGVPANVQVQALQQGTDIVTATPGRLIELIETGAMDLTNIRFFVLDEADNLIENNNDIIMKIHARLPKARLQVLLFSATLHSQPVRDMADKITKFPTWIDLKGKDAVPETVDHTFVWADPTKDLSWQTQSAHKFKTDGIHRMDNIKPGSTNPETLSEEIKALKPLLLLKIINAHKMDQAMVFMRTKLECDHLEEYMRALGGNKKGPVEGEYSCVSLHGDRSVQERKENLRKFKDGEVRFLLCTDVAARGIDIRELPFVINYTLPDKPEEYIHRTGRVGRADRMGLAISIVGSTKEKVWYHQCATRGKGCANTELVEKGGCAIWYDEPQYWQEIQQRLNQEVAPLDANFQHAAGANVVYGQKRKADGAVDYEVHVDQIKDQVCTSFELIIYVITNFLHFCRLLNWRN